MVKWLLDFGVYLLIIYFLLNVEEGMMIELIEIEFKEMFDYFIDILISIVEEVKNDFDKVLEVLYIIVIDWLDEVIVVCKLILKFENFK